MKSGRDMMDAISSKVDFEFDTQALGLLGCKAITAAVMLDDVWEQAQREEVDGRTFVRRLLGLVARRMKREHEEIDRNETETRLSEPDISLLTEEEIESFAREICAHNAWLFESREFAGRFVKSNENTEQLASPKGEEVTFPRNEGERDSDYLVRAVCRFMTEQARRRSSVGNIASQLSKVGISSLTKNLGGVSWSTVAYTVSFGETVKSVMANRDMYHRIMPPRRTAIELPYAHPTWFGGGVGLVQPQPFSVLAEDSYRNSCGSVWESVTNRLTASERLMGAVVDFKTIDRPIELSTPFARRFVEPVSSMIADYRKLAESIRTPSDVARLPRFVFPEAAREVLASSYAANVLRVPDEDNAEQNLIEIWSATEADVEKGSLRCLALLEAIDPALVRLYNGAYDALQGSNVDRERHCLSSLRELYNHLMINIAPDQLVLAWIGDDETLLYEGRPTRKARICYVLRELNNGPLADFTASDTKSFVNFLAVFNRLHDLHLELSQRELRALWLRANSWLGYILEFVQSSDASL